MQRTRQGGKWAPWVFSNFFLGVVIGCVKALTFWQFEISSTNLVYYRRGDLEKQSNASIPHLASCGKNRFAGVGIVWISCLQASNHLGDSLCFHRQVKRGEKRKSRFWVA